MSVTRYKTINQIVNQIAVETGIAKPAVDVFSTNDVAFSQLVVLANACGYELLEEAVWEILVKEHAIVTESTDSGDYDLPDDFAYMFNQTSWDRTNKVPIIGPLSGQDWQYLEGRDLVSHTIYASFRLIEGIYRIFPQPPPDGLNLHFEYISRNWVRVSTDPDVFADEVTVASDVVMYEPVLFERLLKVRFLEARGFDTTAAASRYDKALQNWTGRDKAAPVINAGRSRSGIPYLDSLYSTPDTGYGSF